MSFIGEVNGGKAYAAGWFLAHAECTRETMQVDADNASTADNGGKYIPMGSIYPANSSSAIGIVYEDVDVTTGDMPASIVTKGVVYEDRLPVVLDSDAKTALEGLGFVFVDEPTVTRPDED